MNRKKFLRWAAAAVSAIILMLSLSTASVTYAATTPPAGGDNFGGSKVSCNIDGDPLTWLLCPVFNGVSSITHHFITAFIIPLLKVPQVDTNPNSGTFIAWSNFRVYGDIFLVIGMIIIVFGQAIGGGVIDAYTAKKVLPRIIIAAILINLSIYIVALMVDLANIAGNGVQALILTPFNDKLNFSPSAAQGVGIFGVGFLGAILAAGSLAGIIIAIFTSFGTVFMAALFAVLPFFFAIVAVFFTLVIRQGIIYLLIIISPVAFALYVLPNTEKMFHRWWELLLETLLVYPIVIAIIASADVLSGTVMQANGAQAAPSATSASILGWVTANPIAALVSMGLQVAPLFLIPFAFRIAGGTLARGHDIFNKGAAGLTNGLKQRAEYAKRDYNVLKDRGQQNAYRGLKDNVGKTRFGRPGAFAYRFAANRVGGYNIEHKVAQNQAMMDKETGEITSAGPDEEVRADTVNKHLLALARKGKSAIVADGHFKEDYDYEMVKDAQGNETGEIKLADAAGKMQTLGNAIAADQRWGNNAQAHQSHLSYVMKKATTADEVDHVVTSFDNLANSWNLTDGEAKGVWTGAAFANQNENLEYKYYTYGDRSDGKAAGLQLNGLGLMREVDDKRGNYLMAQQNADTWTVMRGEIYKAQDTMKNREQLLAEDRAKGTSEGQKRIQAAQETMERGARIASNYASVVSAPALDESGQPIQATGGPARVQEEIRNFVQAASAYDQRRSMGVPRNRPTGSSTAPPDDQQRAA